MGGKVASTQIMAASQNLYSILGVPKNATDDAIRKAYRKLARENHPDLKPGDKAAEERFKQVSSANDVLGNAKKRALYDEFGDAGLREGFNVEQARAYARYGGGGGGGSGGAAPGGGFGFDMGDLFGDIFGGRERYEPPSKGQDLAATVELSLAEALAGKEVVLQLPVGHPCGVCKGSGKRSGGSQRRCSTCRGAGQVNMGGHPGMPKTRCPACQGLGQVGDPCPGCSGQGQVSHQGPVTVRIPSGADHNSKLRVQGRGAPGRGGAGDLILTVRVRPHAWYRREGQDLVVRLPLTVAEALCGTQVNVPTLTGSAQVKIPANTQSGSRLRLRGKGVVRGSTKGDLFVEVHVRLPDANTPETEAAARTLESAYSEPVRAGLSL